LLSGFVPGPQDGGEFPIEIGLSSFATEDGEMSLAIVIDITERKRAKQTEDLLVAELQHRTKNLFAVVHWLALRSLRGDQTLDQAREAFVGRLKALARADHRLTNSAWKGTSLKAVVLAELEPFSGLVKVEGVDDVTLSPQATQNFALALHELAMNASKYGALSQSDGMVTIGWSVSADNGGGSLRFRWQERGGPPVSQSGPAGFGTSLLKATLGDGRIEHAAEGLTYEVVLPLSRLAFLQRLKERALPPGFKSR